MTFGSLRTEQYHQRLQRPIILEPMVKLKSESDSPLDWFFNMVSRVMEPPKKSPPPMIGPIMLPGTGGSIYIRQVENSKPWESNHIVIKMMKRDPVTGATMPIENIVPSVLPYYRGEVPNKPQAYQIMNIPSGRSNNMIQPNLPPSATNHQPHSYPSWPGQQRYQRQQQYSAPYNKPFRPNSPNDFRYDSYGKPNQGYSKGYPEDYNNRRPYQHFQPNTGLPNREPDSSMYHSVTRQAPNDPGNQYNDQQYKESIQEFKGQSFYQSTGKPDSPRTTQLPYPDYSGLRQDAQRPMNLFNESINSYQSLPRYRQVARSVNRHNYKGGRTFNSQGSQGSKDFIRDGSHAKFDIDDVVGGIEVITAPNLKAAWTQGLNQGVGSARVTELNQDEDSVSMGNGKSLARGESADHEDDEQDVLQTVTRTSYNIMNRAHRGPINQNVSATQSSGADRIGVNATKEKFAPINVIKEPVTKIDNSTAAVVENVMNLTASTRWQFQEKRKPRFIKTIYRRRLIVDDLKNHSEYKKINSSLDKNSSRTSEN